MNVVISDNSSNLPGDLIGGSVGVDIKEINLMLNSKYNRGIHDARDVLLAVKNRVLEYWRFDEFTVPYFTFIIRKGTNQGSVECNVDWEGKRIACLDRTSYNLSRSIVHGYFIEGEVEVIPVDLDLGYGTPRYIREWMEKNTFDYAVLTCAQGSEASRLLKSQEGITLTGFDKSTSIERMGVFYPSDSFRMREIADLMGFLSIESGKTNTTNLEISVKTENVVVFECYRLLVNPAFNKELDFRENFTSKTGPKYDKVFPDYAFDPEYRCFNQSRPDSIDDDYVKCVSKYNSLGESVGPGIWDRKCRRDEECPWSPVGGSCEKTTGYCSVPIGVNTLSYRAYSTRGKYHKPMCFRDKGVECDRGSRNRYRFPSKTPQPIALFPSNTDP